MKKFIKSKLSLLLTIAIIFTMAIPTGLMTSAAPVTTPAELNAMIADIAMQVTHTVDYHINGEITRAISIYKSFDSAQQASVANYDTLIAARAVMDARLNDKFNVSVIGWDDSERATMTPWVASYTDIQQAASRQAVADELKYQYARLGFLSGSYEDRELQLSAEWGDIMLVQLDAQPNDNIGNPWGQYDRLWGYVAVPFSGMAFSSTGYFSQHETRPAISNTFHMNGNVYIQYWDRYRTYAYQPIDIQATRPSITTANNFPGSDGSADITKNSFRYAFAKYNSDAKALDNDEVVGIPSNFVRTAGTALYQTFTSPSGTKYIASATYAINNADTNRPEDTQIAFVIDDTTVAAITQLGSGDFAAGLAQTGAPISNLTDDVQYFEFVKFTHNQDGSVTIFPLTDVERIIISINNIPNQITKDNYYTDAIVGTVNTAITNIIANAEADYEALSAADKALVTNYAKLTEAKAQIATLIADRDAGLDVTKRISALPNTITLENEIEIVSIRAAYDALTPAQSWYVENIFDIVWAENEICKRKAEVIDARIDALISIEDFAILYKTRPSDAFNQTVAEIVEAVEIYMALPPSIQRYVSIHMYDKLYGLYDFSPPPILLPDAFMPSITISSNTQVSENATSRYDILWNATILIADSTNPIMYDEFNNIGVKIKEYGVYYGTSESAVENWEYLGITPTLSASLKKYAFDSVPLYSDDEIDIHGSFGFRLKNCPLGSERAAAFYLTYEYQGTIRTVISDIDVVNPPRYA